MKFALYGTPIIRFNSCKKKHTLATPKLCTYEGKYFLSPTIMIALKMIVQVFTIYWAKSKPFRRPRNGLIIAFKFRKC